MIGTYAKRIRDDDYPWAPTEEQREAFFELMRNEWGGPVGIDERAPSMANDEEFREWWATYLRMGASPGCGRCTDQNECRDRRSRGAAVGPRADARYSSLRRYVSQGRRRPVCRSTRSRIQNMSSLAGSTICLSSGIRKRYLTRSNSLSPASVLPANTIACLRRS